jgi:mRNA-degrading endonuclease RelE of RelBE toxin-antitoxin system
MTYNIFPSKDFLKQLKNLNSNTKELIENKINFIKENPYRSKRIRSKRYSKVFRIRFSTENKEMRLIYVILEPNIILVCLLDRKKDYKDLEKYLDKIKKEL